MFNKSTSKYADTTGLLHAQKQTDFSCLIYFEFVFLQLGPGSFRPGQQLQRGEQDREPVEQ